MAAFTPPPPAPQRGDRATFSSRVDAFLTWLVQLIPQLNAFIASLNAGTVGGANTFIYTFDSATDDVDPGNGKLRLGSTTQNIANALRIDNLAGTGVAISDFLNALGAVSSNVKGSVRLQKVSDPTSWILLDISTVTAATGYFNLTTVVRASSAPNPFMNGDSLALFFDRNGDKGDGGGTPTQQQIRDAIGTVQIANGGTGSTTAQGARQNLGAMAADAVIPIAQGGTGATTSTAARNAIGALGKSAVNDSMGTVLQGNLVPNIAAINDTNGNNVPLIIGNGGNNFASASIQFLRGGQLGVIFGLDTDNKIKIGGLGYGANAYEVYHAGSQQISAPLITQTSDERKKENWRVLTDEQLRALAGMTKAGIFDWVDGGSGAGGSAQQIQKIIPQVVHTRPETGELSVDYGGLNFAINQAILRRLKERGLL